MKATSRPLLKTAPRRHSHTTVQDEEEEKTTKEKRHVETVTGFFWTFRSKKNILTVPGEKSANLFHVL